MDDELTAIVERMMAAVAEQGGGPDWPQARPEPGQSREQWAARVQRLREQHDAFAVEGMRRFGTPGDVVPVGSVTYAEIPSGDGFIAGRVYAPAGDGPHPALLFFHGGAFWMGGGAVGFDLNDASCRGLCAQLGAVVVNVDYRLSPENPYPAQLDDGYAALSWLVEQAPFLQIDVDRIGVLGISSGGNLAAALCLLARDRGGPSIKGQILLAPALDLDVESGRFSTDPVLHATVSQLRGYYGQDDPDWTSPYVSPVLADDLEGLPATVIVTGEFDPLKDGGLDYGRRLREQGVAAENLHYPMTHTAATPAVTAQSMTDLLAGATRILG